MHFSSALPVIVYTRPAGQPGWDWQEVDRGPGYFDVPDDQEIGVRLKGIDDGVLAVLVEELRAVETLVYLDLSENRNVTNEGMVRLRGLPQLRGLNLSSCTITSSGLTPLKALLHLKWLILTYCNRLNDSALKTLESMSALEYVDLQGCYGFTQGGFSRVRRRSLKIHR